MHINVIKIETRSYNKSFGKSCSALILHGQVLEGLDECGFLNASLMLIGLCLALICYVRLSLYYDLLKFDLKL